MAELQGTIASQLPVLYSPGWNKDPFKNNCVSVRREAEGRARPENEARELQLGRNAGLVCLFASLKGSFRV